MRTRQKTKRYALFGVHARNFYEHDAQQEDNQAQEENQAPEDSAELEEPEDGRGLKAIVYSPAEEHKTEVVSTTYSCITYFTPLKREFRFSVPTPKGVSVCM
jgi:hypothetical protein